MKIVNKFKLCVSPLTGQAFISAIDKKGLMTDNRRLLQREEILAFIHQWATYEAEATRSNVINITKEGKKVLSIEITEQE